MYQKSKHYLVLYAVIVLVSLTASIASAAPVTQSITYQGKLTNAAGSPLTGTYNVASTIYDANTGGNIVSTDTHSVTTTNGLFTTTVAVTNPALVDGRALWLGIKVGSDAEMTPRQEIRPVPYALSLRPGAWITSSNSHTLNLVNTGHASVLNISQTGGYSPGVRLSTTGSSSPGVEIETINGYSDGVNAFTHGDNSYGVYVSTLGTASHGVYSYTSGDNSDGVRAYTSGDYSNGVSGNAYGDKSHGVDAFASGAESTAIYANSNKYIGVFGYGKEGGFFSTNQGGTNWWTDRRPAINVSTVFQYNPGMYVDTLQSNSPGVYATTHGDNSQGFATTTYGSGSPGFNAYTAGLNSPAVRAESAQDVGVYGKGKEGGYFTTNQAGTYQADFAGVNITTNYDYNSGVSASTTGIFSPGITAQTSGDHSSGVNVYTTNAFSDGIIAYATGQYSYGIHAHSSQADAIYAYTASPTGYGLNTPNYIYAKGSKYPTVDVAEYFSVEEGSGPGTVMVIGPAGTLQISTTAYDTRVAGIVSTAPAVSLGAKDTGNPGEAPLAVAGRVPCKVDASYGAIYPGDVLTTSPTSGYAMKAMPVEIAGVEIYKPSTVLGKALGSLESGTGTIEVLVTLQ